MSLARILICSMLFASHAFSSASQEPQLERLTLANGVVIAVSHDHKSAIVSMGDAQQTLLETESAFLSMSAISDREGQTIGVSLFENWENGYSVLVYMTSGVGLERAATFNSPTTRIGITDWDGDGDVDFAVPAGGSIEDLFFSESPALFVFEREGGAIWRTSVSCMPTLSNYLANEVSSLEGRYRSHLARGRTFHIGRVELSESELGRIPNFIQDLRGAIAAPCNRERVPQR